MCVQRHDGAHAEALRQKWRTITRFAGLGDRAHTWKNRGVACGNLLLTTQLRSWVVHIWERTMAGKRRCARRV